MFFQRSIISIVNKPANWKKYLSIKKDLYSPLSSLSSFEFLVNFSRPENYLCHTDNK